MPTLFQSENMTGRRKYCDVPGGMDDDILGIKAIRYANVQWVHLTQDRVQ
jgi:hypothetical protein